MEAAVNLRYWVDLSQDERSDLSALTSGGKHAARRVKRAQILLAADAGAPDETIAANVAIGLSTVTRMDYEYRRNSCPGLDPGVPPTCSSLSMFMAAGAR